MRPPLLLPESGRLVVRDHPQFAHPGWAVPEREMSLALAVRRVARKLKLIQSAQLVRREGSGGVVIQTQNLCNLHQPAGMVRELAHLKDDVNGTRNHLLD